MSTGSSLAEILAAKATPLPLDANGVAITDGDPYYQTINEIEQLIREMILCLNKPVPSESELKRTAVLKREIEIRKARIKQMTSAD